MLRFAGRDFSTVMRVPSVPESRYVKNREPVAFLLKNRFPHTVKGGGKRFLLSFSFDLHECVALLIQTTVVNGRLGVVKLHNIVH